MFQLVPRTFLPLEQAKNLDIVVLMHDSPTTKAEDIALELVEKARLPFHALYFLEWSARWWEIFSHSESEIRVQYEAGT